MQSQNFRYISRIDHLRFFAFLLVFLFHFRFEFPGEMQLSTANPASIKEMLKLWVEGGYSGVSLFLVLSGFLFCLIADGGNKNIRYLPFIYNRILRIFPLLTVLVFIVISVHRGESTPMDILRLLTLQLNTGHPWTGWGHSELFPSGPIWTIAVEFQFYLIFPLLIGFVRQNGLRWLCLAMLLMIVIRLLVIGNASPQMYYPFYHTILGRLDQFLIGMFAAILYLHYPRFLSRPAAQWLCVVFLLVAFPYLFHQRKESWFGAAFSFPCEAILWSLFIVLYLRFPFPNSPRIDRALAWLGSLSFSLYLFHEPVLFFMMKKAGLAQPHSLSDLLLKSALIIPVVILFAALTYYTVEKPFFAKRVKYT